MTPQNIDSNISKDSEAMLDLVTKFSMDIMRKAGIELDKMSKPEDVIASDSVLWDVHRKYQELGLHTARIPKHLGGTAGEADPLASVLMIEQFGYSDTGLAISLGVSAGTFHLASQFPHPDMQQLARDYCEDKEAKMIGCWAITEPDHGSDWVIAESYPQCGPSVKAVLKGDEYILNGEKSAWVSNGTIATHATLHVSLDPSRGMQGHWRLFR